MDLDIKQIGIFGLSFSRGLDQSWVNLWRKEEGYSIDFFQDADSDVDEDDDFIQSETMISFEEGEEVLRRVFEDGRISEWKQSYTSADEGIETNISWTLDIDDLEEKDLFLSSGNGKLPPRDMIMGALEAFRVHEPHFAMCFKELRP